MPAGRGPGQRLSRQRSLARAGSGHDTEAVSEPTRTKDGRYVVIDGRKWRATDPSIPEPLRVALVKELMAARRAVRAAASDEEAVRAARGRVRDAKVALGERGCPWWEEATDEQLAPRLAAAFRALLRGRAEDATVCPSDGARVAGGEGWRARMDLARRVAQEGVARGELQLLRGGEPVEEGAELHGPIRVGRGPRFR